MEISIVVNLPARRRQYALRRLPGEDSTLPSKHFLLTVDLVILYIGNPNNGIVGSECDQCAVKDYKPWRLDQT